MNAKIALTLDQRRNAWDVNPDKTDLPKGCKIVSVKSFSPGISSTLNDIEIELEMTTEADKVEAKIKKVLNDEAEKSKETEKNIVMSDDFEIY